ncbi:MAG: sigma-70 family RNA polymerase sigma factor [Chloroflexi bacterium]|nr:sigma-70 family RNA polymerase sigma factor [Chloroflexota bacterium]
MCIECPAALATDPRAAFPTFVRHHQDLVYGLARRWTRDAADAEDVAQDSFLRAWRAIERYPPERIRELHTRGWLARIVRNVAHNRARDAAPAHATLEDAPEPVDPEARTPVATLMRRESARTWAARLAQLPDRQRIAVELRHVHGLSYAEMTEALERPVNTIKSDVHRGIRTLRASMEAADDLELEVAR